jgi:hypothetical protein
MSRAVSIRAQLKKYMQRFNLPIESCEGDAKRLRKCLVSGYWRNGARWVADGTYRSVRGNRVWAVALGALYVSDTTTDIACPPDFGSFHTKASLWLGRLPRNGRD